jgi:hypothetical protein
MSLPIDRFFDPDTNGRQRGSCMIVWQAYP